MPDGSRRRENAKTRHFRKSPGKRKSTRSVSLRKRKKSENRAPGIADRVHIRLSLPVAANIARFGIFPLFSLCRKSKSKYAHIIAYNVYIFVFDEKSLHKKALVGRKNSI